MKRIKLLCIFVTLICINIQEINAQMPTYESVTNQQNELRNRNYGQPSYNNINNNDYSNTYQRTNYNNNINESISTQHEVSDPISYNKGYKMGYKAGYCHGKTTPCNPMVIEIPIPSDQIYNYQNGYNNGFIDGQNDQ